MAKEVIAGQRCAVCGKTIQSGEWVAGPKGKRRHAASCSEESAEPGAS